MNLETEFQAYLTMAIWNYPDDVEDANEIVRDLLCYKSSDAIHASAEMAYIQEHGKLPDWAIVIESFEELPDGTYQFVWYSPWLII